MVTSSATTCGEAPARAPPTAPHSSTAVQGGAEAPSTAHCTHALALKASCPPVGKEAGAFAPAVVM